MSTSIPSSTRLMPTLANPGSFYPIADWVCSGYVLVTRGDTTTWMYVQANSSIDPLAGTIEPTDVEAFFCREDVYRPLIGISRIFWDFIDNLPIQWEADMRRSPHPQTLLRLWETVLSVFMYYTEGKQLETEEIKNYFWLVLHYCNGDFSTDFLEHHLESLKPSRVREVIAELDAYFQRSYPAGKKVPYISNFVNNRGRQLTHPCFVPTKID